MSKRARTNTQGEYNLRNIATVQTPSRESESYDHHLIDQSLQDSMALLSELNLVGGFDDSNESDESNFTLLTETPTATLSNG